MSRTIAIHLTMALCLVMLQAVAAQPASAADYKKVSERTVGGFQHPESVAYDPNAKVLYAGEFGPMLKPALKDAKGYIMKLSLDGKVLDKHFLPAPGVTMDKPKGIWVEGNHLWTTDIDSVWEFDLTTKKGRKLPLPGATFANDPTVMNGTLYVSDNRSDKLFAVTPANFLGVANPKVETVFSGLKVNPNGLYPGNDGSLLMGGFDTPKDPHPIYSMKPGGKPIALTKPIGRVDGLYQAKDGTIIATDWDSGSAYLWTKMSGMTKIATGFKGPADLTVIPEMHGLTVVVPDLVKSEIRFIKLSE